VISFVSMIQGRSAYTSKSKATSLYFDGTRNQIMPPPYHIRSHIRFSKSNNLKSTDLNRSDDCLTTTGVSGGEEGALLGPSIMPGGSPKAWDAVNTPRAVAVSRQQKWQKDYSIFQGRIVIPLKIVTSLPP
jgi:hypothetical protein